MRRGQFGIETIATIRGAPESGFSALVTAKGYPMKVDLPSAYAQEPNEPLNLIDVRQEWWAYKDHIYEVSCCGEMSAQDISVRLKHAVFTEKKKVLRMRRELEALENLERLPSARRERIPDSVRLFVWQRDEGQCVACKSKANLEFDHIIPVAEGGANTERNIQLLCEACNRAKGKNVVG